MIENLLDQSVFKNGHEVSFILGHKILSKTGREWVEVKGEPLSNEEWEDLKDICLLGNEKIQLETKGFVAGIYNSKKHSWKFSFIERKDCFRAHMSLVKTQEEKLSQIEYPLFWESVKKEKGLFIVAGERRQGKSSLLQEIVLNDQKNKLSLIGVHTAISNQSWPIVDSVFQLGADTIDYDFSHIVYDGIEKIIIDTNSIKNWKKWIEIAEQGQSVILSISSNSIRTIMSKLSSELDENSCHRLFNVLNGVVVQKLVGQQYHPCSEILVIKDNQRSVLQGSIKELLSLRFDFQKEFKDSYQSMNQSIIQKLIRRKIDVKAAFEASDDPDNLDLTLKKMGL